MSKRHIFYVEILSTGIKHIFPAKIEVCVTEKAAIKDSSTTTCANEVLMSSLVRQSFTFPFLGKTFMLTFLINHIYCAHAAKRSYYLSCHKTALIGKGKALIVK